MLNILIKPKKKKNFHIAILLSCVPIKKGYQTLYIYSFIYKSASIMHQNTFKTFHKTKEKFSSFQVLSYRDRSQIKFVIILVVKKKIEKKKRIFSSVICPHLYIDILQQNKRKTKFVYLPNTNHKKMNVCASRIIYFEFFFLQQQK